MTRNISGDFGITIFETLLQYATKSKILGISQFSSLRSHDSAIIKEYIQFIVLKAQIAVHDIVFVAAAWIALFGALMTYWIKVNKEVNREVFVE